LKSYISKKTLEDLEFDQVLDLIQQFAKTDLGRKVISEISPIENKMQLITELQYVDEYLSSFQSENKIPNHEFEEISTAIHLLGIKGSFIEASMFNKIKNVVSIIKELKIFFIEYKDYFTALFHKIESIDVYGEIIQNIDKVVTSYHTVKDQASDELKYIRDKIKKVNSVLSGSFNKSLTYYNKLDYLDDIKESVVDNHRVLAVKAMHRRKVKGSIVGTSKTGSIIFIIPESTLKNVRELEVLQIDEKEEIIKILKHLTDNLRPFKNSLFVYQKTLTDLDVIASKALYANSIHAVLPKIVKEKKIYFKNAFHPLLLEKNKELDEPVIPQTITLDKKQQIIVISGPNAGGKSITLKSVGLLQVMLQSGILIPVDETSETYIFERILTDIGDNQSIENQLSTYSYRLKNMRNFLKRCNDKTLFLIDEFGTGSDPELGGALAEVFLEEFYQKDAYGIITTHYSNLKVLADELDNMVNANMQFDTRTYQPMFKLVIGQAGSSFTFEVAQKNGIPFSLINKAKKKVEREKIRLDKTILKLQGERNKLQKNNHKLQIEQEKHEKVSKKLLEKQEKIQRKIENIQELYDNNQKMLVIGRKVNEFINRYFQTNNKKKLQADFNKWIAMEKATYLENKKKKISKGVPAKKSKNINLQETDKVALTIKNPDKPSKRDLRILKKIEKQKEAELQQRLQLTEKQIKGDIHKIRTQKQKVKQEEINRIKNYVFKVGDLVKIKDTTMKGTIDKIEKNTIFINFGTMISKTTKDKLELVK
jgi:DNA mismatch repair protein MutS2